MTSEENKNIITDEEQDDTDDLNLWLSDKLKEPFIREAGYRQFMGQQGAYFASVPLSLIVNEALAAHHGKKLAPRKTKGTRKARGEDRFMYMQKIPRVINAMIDETVVKDNSNRTAVVEAAMRNYELSYMRVPMLSEDLIDLIEAESFKTGIDKNVILETAVRTYLNAPK